MRAILALVLAVGIGAAVWVGTREDTSSPPSPITELTPTDPTTATDPASETGSVRVYFVRDEVVGAVAREVPAPALLRGALEQLLTGPSDDEAALGFTTALPDDVRLLAVAISEGTATIDLSGEVEAGGGSSGMFLRLAQLVHTATQFPTVKRVALRIDGAPVRTFSSEGIVVDDTLTRADYEDQAPAILVESPLPGGRVGRTFAVTGTANTFEATLNWELEIGPGKPRSGFTTATCGTGCRGTFRFEVTSPDAGEGVLRVFELSAEDGSRIKLVEIPLVVG